MKVFILAGQSNMEGKAPNELLEHQAKDPKTKHLFAHLRKDDKWIVRDDVFVKFLDRHGPLTIGFGSSGRTGFGGYSYYYLGSAIWFNCIGEAMGEAMLELLKDQK